MLYRKTVVKNYGDVSLDVASAFMNRKVSARKVAIWTAGIVAVITSIGG